MIDSVNSNTIDDQNNHLKRYRRQKFTDIHCHCLPGFDDGPATMAESLTLCRRLAEEGIGTVVATPHQLGRFEGCNEAVNVREAVRSLNEALRNSDVLLKIVPGGEVRVDKRIYKLLEADKILTLADGGRYILLELPHQVFIDIDPLLAELDSMGIQPVISHAEKIATLAKQPQVLLRWLEHSTHLQITASSLVGDFGSKVQKVAWHFLTSGWAILVATDSHDTNVRKPQMKAAFRCIGKKLGEDIARLVCIENPSRVVNGQHIVPVLLYDQQEVER
jgi:protein-tyrosine phosphatase